MPYFLSPRKILFGKGMLKRLGMELEGRGNKAFMITDKNMAKISQPLVDAVKNAGYEVRIWDEAEPEPSTAVAVKAYNALQEFKPQLIIAFGGGSVIDTAKAAWVFFENPDLAKSDITTTVNVKTKLNTQRISRFLAVPTTSGTGSDVTWAIVLSNAADHRKIGFANGEIVPDMVLLAPEFTSGMPASLTASTGLDVLGHALDGFTARQQNDFSDGLCLQAMKLTFDWLPRAYKDGNDLAAREKMQNAATIAGLGFGNSNTSLSHAIAHSLGAIFGIPHGRAVGIALPYSLDFISSNPRLENAPDPVEKLGLAAKFLGIASNTNLEAVGILIQKIRDLGKSVGEPLSLREFGITGEQMSQNLEKLVNTCSQDINMYSSPCECKGEALKNLFIKIWEGRNIVK
jgi:alcohol dehydrogenase class IV